MFADKSDPELLLLKHGDHGDEFDITAEANRALKTAPIITGDAFELMGPTVFPQRALYDDMLETSTDARVNLRKVHQYRRAVQRDSIRCTSEFSYSVSLK